MREEGLIVASQTMRQAIARLVDVASRGSKSLLLVGPSGSGKEGMARCFHRHSGRAGPFIAKNCATLTRDFVRSELFGAEKGAFTGAVQRTFGAVENAHEGTLFLDEIGELPLDVQPMLLRFLDQGEYERLGHRGPLGRADVCVVGATNKDLRGRHAARRVPARPVVPPLHARGRGAASERSIRRRGGLSEDAPQRSRADALRRAPPPKRARSSVSTIGRKLSRAHQLRESGRALRASGRSSTRSRRRARSLKAPCNKESGRAEETAAPA